MCPHCRAWTLFHQCGVADAQVEEESFELVARLINEAGLSFDEARLRLRTPRFCDVESDLTPLSDDEIDGLFKAAGSPRAFARAIERIHGVLPPDRQSGMPLGF